ncbi:MAG: AAA family ATPase [Cyanobacteria bacterium J06623_5]
MPQLNKSEAVRQRLRVLLRQLVDFANHQLSEYEHLESKISVRWVDRESSEPKLIVKTEIRFLAALVSQTVEPKAKEHLKQDLRTLKDFLGRLEDNRDRTQGTGLWHFTLRLWHTSAERNLTAFDKLWQQRKAETQRSFVKSSVVPPAAVPSSPPAASLLSSPDSAAPAIPISPPPELQTDLPPHHNLPARDYGTFIGREQPLQLLRSFLAHDHSVARISVTGTGGIGKTALALESAHCCVSAYSSADRAKGPVFDALIFVSAKTEQFTPQGILPSYRYSRTLQDLFRAIAKTLKCTSLLTADFGHQRENIYEVLSQQPTLLIIDNLEALSPQSQQAVLSFLYELPAAVKTIVTSRIHLTLDAVIPLGALTTAEGQQFIQHQAALKAVTLDDTACQMLYEHTGGLPAAIVYALGQVSAGHSIPHVLPKLTHQTSDYCRYYLQSTVELLQGQSAYELLIALSMFPTSAQTLALIQVAGLGDEIAAEGLARLQQLSLVTVCEGRYSMLPLACDYFIRKRQVLEAQPIEQAGEQAESVSVLGMRQRWLSWYQQWLLPYRQDNWREWRDYLSVDEEWENIQAVVEWCIATDHLDAFDRLWRSLRGYTYLRGYWNERLSWLEWWVATLHKSASVQAAKAVGPTVSFADDMMLEALSDLGWTLALMGQSQQLEAASGYFTQAWERCQDADLKVQLDLAIDLAVVALFQDRLDEVGPQLEVAEGLLSRASLSQEEQAQQAQRVAYYKAQLCYRQGDYPGAKSLYRQILAAVQSDGVHSDGVQSDGIQSDWEDQSAFEEVSAIARLGPQQQTAVYTLNWLVDIALQQSNLDEAEQLLAQSWPIIQSRKDRRSQAFHQRSKARLEELRGNTAGFRRWTQAAQVSFRDLGMQSQVEEMQSWLGRNV